ncbi:hypothetical protein niasHS_017538 [Heterodera schachtii]|uniref:Uncharacterized protein n=1 Tax=Heterodera schachtii TaxID=97005 RepID=A0ABD2HXT9_HETSC
MAPSPAAFPLQSPTFSCQSNGLVQLQHCIGCQCLIMDSQLAKIFPGHFLHEHCAVCSICNVSLMSCRPSIKCYEKEGRLFCRTHYFEYFVPKTICAGCNLSIQLDELFCTLKDGIAFHCHCLRCFQCGKTFKRGDRLLLGENCENIECVEHISKGKWPKGAAKSAGRESDEKGIGRGTAEDKGQSTQSEATTAQDEAKRSGEATERGAQSERTEEANANMAKGITVPWHSLNSDKEEEQGIGSGPNSGGEQSATAAATAPKSASLSMDFDHSPTLFSESGSETEKSEGNEEGTKREPKEKDASTKQSDDEEEEEETDESSTAEEKGGEALSEREECWKRMEEEEEDGEEEGEEEEEEEGEKEEVGREKGQRGRGKEKGNGRDGRRKTAENGRGGGEKAGGESRPTTVRSMKRKCANTSAGGPLLQYPSEMYAAGEQFSREEEDAQQKTHGNKRRGPRTTISQKQLDILNRMFDNTSKPTKHERAQLAQDSGLSMRVIQVWFQNRRSKERRLKHLCNFLRHYEDQRQRTDGEKKRENEAIFETMAQ